MEQIKKTASLEKICSVLLLISFSFSLFATPFLFFLFCAMILFIFNLLRNKNPLSLPLSAHEILLFIFMFFLMISSLFSKNPIGAWQGFGVFSFYILIYFYFKIMPLKRKQFETIIYCICGCVLLSCGFALFQYFIIRGDIDVSLFGHKYFTIYRVIPWVEHKPLISIFDHPARAGNLISILFAVILPYLVLNFKSIKWPVKTVLISALFMSLLAIYLMHNREAILSVIAASLICAVLPRKYIALSVIVIMAVFFIAFKSDKLISTLQNPLESPNVRPRVMQYEAGLSIYSKHNLLLGIGLLNFETEFKNNYSNRSGYDDVAYIHNNYLALLVETGILGIIAFYGFVLMFIISLIKNRGKSWNTVTLSTISVMAGFLISSIFDAILYVVPVGAFFWIITGLSQNRTALTEQENNSIIISSTKD